MKERWQRCKKMTRNQQFLCCYCLVLGLMLGAIVVRGAALTLLHFSGAEAEKTLSLADFQPVNLKILDENTVETITDDGQLLYTGEEAIRTLRVRCRFLQEPGEFVAFYADEQPNFSVKKMLYPEVQGDVYTFSFPLESIHNLRLDFGIFSGVTAVVEELTLNAYSPAYAFLLNFPTLLALLVAPAVLGLLANGLAELLAQRRTA